MLWGERRENGIIVAATEPTGCPFAAIGLDRGLAPPSCRSCSAHNKRAKPSLSKPFYSLVAPTGIEPVTSKIFGDLSNRRRFAQTIQNWLPTGSHIVAKRMGSAGGRHAPDEAD